MARRTYEFEIAAKVDQAVKAITSFSAGAQKQLSSLSLGTSISAIRDGFDLVAGAGRTAFGAVSGAIQEVTKEAIEAEAANFKMANALRLSGEFSEKAARDFRELAKSIQDTTTFTDDAVLASVGLAKQYGLTNAETTKTISVAKDLAAITGDSLTGATQRLAQTFNGFVDKELGKMNPALRNLSLEALNSGKALEMIRPAVEGTAAALAGTFGGQVSNISKNMGELNETFGSFITQNPVIRESLGLINDALKKLNDEIGKNGESIRGLITGGFLLLINAMPLLARGLENLTKNFAAIYFAGKGLAAILGAVGAAIANITNNAGKQEIFNSLMEDLDNLQTEFGAFLNSTDDVFKPLISQADKLAAAVTAVAKANKGATESLAALSQGKKGGGLAARGLDPEELERYTQQVGNLKDKFDDLIRTKIQGLANAPLEGVIKFAIKGQEEIDKTKREIDLAIREIISSKRIPDALKQQAIGFAEEAKNAIGKGLKDTVLPALATNLVSAVKKGAAGALEFVASAAGAVADAYFPGLGQFVTQLTEFLGQGKEAVREQIMAFEKAVPAIIQNITEAIPAVFEAILDDMPMVIQKSIEMIPRIFSAWLNFLPNLFEKIIQMLPEIIQAFIKGFIDAIPQMFVAFGQALYDSAATFVEALLKAATNVGGLLGIGGGGGDGRSVIETVLDPFGIFAQGGRVPNEPRYEGDRFTARLNAGEQVLSKDLSADLESYLRQGGGGGGDINVTAIVQVSEQELARALFRINRGGFRTA